MQNPMTKAGILIHSRHLRKSLSNNKLVTELTEASGVTYNKELVQEKPLNKQYSNNKQVGKGRNLIYRFATLFKILSFQQIIMRLAKK